MAYSFFYYLVFFIGLIDYHFPIVKYKIHTNLYFFKMSDIILYVCSSIVPIPPCTDWAQIWHSGKFKSLGSNMGHGTFQPVFQMQAH